ncbi:DUF1846 domain-containing protein [Arcanobacterium canis]
MKIGFDSAKYIQMQSEHIATRRAEFGGKLYLELGGKLFDDLHASRVLPGFTPDNKIAMLDQLRDDIEIVIAVNAHHLERKKVRADLGISYEQDVLRLVDVFRGRGFLVNNIVMTQVTPENMSAAEFQRKLEALGMTVTRHYPIAGYPTNTELIVSDEGYGKNEYVETTRDLIVVTAPGPGSGKMATCLSQMYHDSKKGITSGYAKFETFPIWNLPLDHPVNLAYEAATADLDDVNMIDPFHLAAYGTQAVNYNRDVEVFPVLLTLLERVMGRSPYKSPTDMGVNMVGYCISDDEACRYASTQEVIRRYFKARVIEEEKMLEPVQSERIAITMSKLGVKPEDRPVVTPARRVAEETGAPASAIELTDGTILTGKTSTLLGNSSAMLLNALKHIAGLDDDLLLLSPESIHPIQTLKTEHLGSANPRLHMDEVLIALAVSAESDPNAHAALDAIGDLAGTDVHTTTILGSVDTEIFRKLGINVTSDPVYQTKTLYKK